MKNNVVKKSLTLIMAVVLAVSALLLYYAVTDDSAVYAKSKTLKVKEIDYDHTLSKVEFEFNQRVKYKKLKVVIKYRDGKNMVTRILEKDSDELEVKVRKLKYGKVYSYKITGIRKAGSKKCVVLKGTFRAIDR